MESSFPSLVNNCIWWRWWSSKEIISTTVFFLPCNPKTVGLLFQYFFHLTFSFSRSILLTDSKPNLWCIPSFRGSSGIYQCPIPWLLWRLWQIWASLLIKSSQRKQPDRLAQYRALEINFPFLLSFPSNLWAHRWIRRFYLKQKENQVSLFLRHLH